ncbi:MAG: hypothetical protein ACFFFT_11235 [Candidatus Thorarchaeota archaeon]
MKKEGVLTSINLILAINKGSKDATYDPIMESGKYILSLGHSLKDPDFWSKTLDYAASLEEKRKPDYLEIILKENTYNDFEKIEFITDAGEIKDFLNFGEKEYIYRKNKFKFLEIIKHKENCGRELNNHSTRARSQVLNNWIELYSEWFLNNGYNVPELNNNLKKSLKGKEKRIFYKFPKLLDLSWREVEISFVSKDSLRIKARNEIKKYNFAEIGFKDKRKGDLPVQSWEVLFTLAEYNGRIDWDIPNLPIIWNKIPKCIQELRKILKELMNIDDNPFYSYRKHKAYKTKFTISDESYRDK